MSDTIIENVNIPVTDEDNQDEVDDTNLLSVLDVNTTSIAPKKLAALAAPAQSTKNEWTAVDFFGIFVLIVVIMFVIMLIAHFFLTSKSNSSTSTIKH